MVYGLGEKMSKTVYKVVLEDEPNKFFSAVIRNDDLIVEYKLGELAVGPLNTPIMTFESIEFAKAFMKQWTSNNRNLAIFVGECDDSSERINFVRVLFDYNKNNELTTKKVKAFWDRTFFKIVRKTFSYRRYCNPAPLGTIASVNFIPREIVAKSFMMNEKVFIEEKDDGTWPKLNSSTDGANTQSSDITELGD